MAEVTNKKRRGRPPKNKAETKQNIEIVGGDRPIGGRGRKAVESDKKPVVKKTATAKTKQPKQAKSKSDMPKIGVVSLGCDKNRVDTETMLTRLKTAGYLFTADPKDADAIIINTCCFIRSARDESEDAIAEMIEYKTKGKCKFIIVTGCLAQFDMKSVQNEFPEADAIIGINEYKNITKIVDNLFGSNKRVRKNNSPECVDWVCNRVTTTAPYVSYLKIADGCNNFCSFCTIPYIRGRYRSRTIESLVKEAEGLAAAGTKELILVAQDTTRYGIDIYGKPMLVELLKKLSKIEGIVWIRLLYCYPEMVSDELIDEIFDNPKVCKYIDVPFQHVSNNVLKRMNRHCTYDQTRELILKLKSHGQFVSIRTTYMVGFPGETKKDFKILYNFIKGNRLTNVGFFKYSREPGTQAYDFDDQVDEATKNKRLIKLVKLQKKKHRQVAAMNHVGKTYKVVCEGFDKERKMYVGRSQYQAPEIDTSIYFSSKKPLAVGEFYNVLIKKLSDYDIEGEVL